MQRTNQDKSESTTPAPSSPRNEFYVSQRVTPDFESLDLLSLEEQEILSGIQDLQFQLNQLRVEQEGEDEPTEPVSNLTNPSLHATQKCNQLIIVTNTLPIILERVSQTGQWSLTKTTGGLNTLLSMQSIRKDLRVLWVGSISQHIPKPDQESVRRLLLKQNFLPVFYPSDNIGNRHNLFSSQVLSSLFHYIAEPVATPTFKTHANGPCAHEFHASKRFNKQDYRAYEAANECFADTIAEVYQEGDNIWVHDYHLMLVPSLLRQRVPQCPIGWFLHVPFPTSDVYTRLPVRAQLLTGVLQSDLIGFQTFDYERHFLSVCKQLLGVECSYQMIRTPCADRDHFTSVGVFPIGINIAPFTEAASNPSTLHRVLDLHKRFGDKKIILGIDRLDNVKGIPHKLLAMEYLFEHFPEWQKKVVLVQIGLTCSSFDAGNDTGIVQNTSVGKLLKTQDRKKAESDTEPQIESNRYRNLLSHVNQLVGRINGAYGSLHYAPIHCVHQASTSHEELCALYDLADVCLITSTRDGMNLAPHEFIVCQQHFTRDKDSRSEAKDSTRQALSELLASSKSPREILMEWDGEEGGPGVLVLSEFAGCSHSLSGAIVVNPWNTENVALSIHQALSMCRAERELRQQKLYRYVAKNTAAAWGARFLESLAKCTMKNRGASRQLPNLDTDAIVKAYRQAENRVIVLDYDRALTKQHASLLPLAAVGPSFKSLLDSLSSDPRNTVFIVSGRERRFIETWLKGVGVGVAAEDGFFYRMNLQNPRERWKTMSKFQYDTLCARGIDGSATNAFSAPFDSSTEGTRKKRSASAGSGSAPSRGSFSHPSSAVSPASTPTSMRFTGGPEDEYSDNITGNVVDNLNSAHAWSRKEDDDSSSWKNLVLPTMEMFTDRTPGSYIENKESSLTWHYSDADSQFGSWQAKDLQIILERQLLGTALEVYQGYLYVSVEHDGCTKAKVVEGILKFLSLPEQIAKKGSKVDFILCVCDDVSDDQMFQTLNTLSDESRERNERRSREEKEAMKLRGSVLRSSDVAAPLRRSKDSQASFVSEEDKDFLMEESDSGTRISFSRLHKVPVCLDRSAIIYPVVVGADVRHSARVQGRQSAYSVDSLSDVKKLLHEFMEEVP